MDLLNRFDRSHDEDSKDHIKREFNNNGFKQRSTNITIPPSFYTINPSKRKRKRWSLNQREPNVRFVVGNALQPAERQSDVSINLIDEEEQSLEDSSASNVVNTIPETLELSVVDFGKEGGRYSMEDAVLIEKLLGKAVVKHVLEHPTETELSYGTASWHDGVIVLDCKNRKSHDFIKVAVEKLETWDGSNLKCVRPETNLFMQKVKLEVTDLGILGQDVLNVLRSQNPTINMKNWKIFGEETDLIGFKVYILLVSNPPVSLVQNKELNLFYGAGVVTLKLLDSSSSTDGI